MINTLIFDFGDVFINLDKQAPYTEMKKLGISAFSKEMDEFNKSYEIGRVSTDDFFNFYQNLLPHSTKFEIANAWNSIILDFPEYRLDFLRELSKSKKYQLILLSNTNDLHIEKVIANMTLKRFLIFKECFDAFYLSQEINLRKPHKNIYDFVLKKHNVSASNCFFVDDTLENIITAKKLGIHTWNIEPNTEDVINLFDTNKSILNPFKKLT